MTQLYTEKSLHLTETLDEFWPIFPEQHCCALQSACFHADEQQKFVSIGLLNKLLKPKRQQQQHPILNLWNMIELPKYVSCDSVHFDTSLVALGSALPYL